jgi:TRAP-type mannitol/chloroaromatic compound transport system substrate-binding protein
MSKKSESSPTTRRKFLGGAAMATAATVAAPSVVSAQGPISMRWQSTWPSKDIFHEFALDYAKKVNDMTGGDLKIEVLPAGAVVPAFGLLDAVSKGTLDGGHGVLVYHYGKQTALALWGSGPAFAMDANMLLAWHKYGGGKELLAKLYQSVGANVVSFPYGPMPTQPLGWFKRPVTKVDDLKGLKFRTVGISIDVFQGLGSAVNALPGGEIVSAMDRGLLDAAEFNNPSSDKLLGFPDVSKVYMLQSYHQSCECFEIIFNKKKHDALPPDLQAVLKYAAEASSADMTWKGMDRYSKDLQAMEKDQGVQVMKTPDAVLEAQLAAWDKVIAKLSADQFFAKVVDSQKAWAKRVVSLQFAMEVDQKMAYDHFFGAA